MFRFFKSLFRLMGFKIPMDQKERNDQVLLTTPYVPRKDPYVTLKEPEPEPLGPPSATHNAIVALIWLCFFIMITLMALHGLDPFKSLLSVFWPS